MRIAVIGAGAMGSVVGARLQSPGVEVVLFDINEEHIHAVRTRGLTLGDADGERLVTIAATARIAEVADADLALLLVDSHATADVAPYLPNVLANEGVACTLRNGIGNVAARAAVSGPLRVVAGSTFNSAAFIAPGHVRHTNVGPTAIGMPDGSPTDRVRALEGAARRQLAMRDHSGQAARSRSRPGAGAARGGRAAAAPVRRRGHT